MKQKNSLAALQSLHTMCVYTQWDVCTSEQEIESGLSPDSQEPLLQNCWLTDFSSSHNSAFNYFLLDIATFTCPYSIPFYFFVSWDGILQLKSPRIVSILLEWGFGGAFLRTFFKCSELVCLELTLSVQPNGEMRASCLVSSGMALFS